MVFPFCLLLLPLWGDFVVISRLLSRKISYGATSLRFLSVSSLINTMTYFAPEWDVCTLSFGVITLSIQELGLGVMTKV